MFKFLSYTLLTVLTVDLLATSGDITMTWTSPILPKLYSNDSNVNPFDRPINNDEESWISSLINIGAMVGPFPYGFIADKLGRKIGLLCIAVPQILSYLILAFSRTVYWYYFARILGGIAVGGGYTLLPMYVAEIAEDSNRGMLSMTLNIFWTFGNLIPYVIGPYMDIVWFNTVLACVPLTFFILFLTIAPESPYYLLVKNKMDQAEDALMRLRSYNKKKVKSEIRHIQVETKKNDDKTTLLQFFKSKIYMKGLTISLILIIAQQLSGVSAVLFYTQEIFEEAGADALPPEVSSIIIGLVIFSTSFGTPFVVDGLGRRLLMLVSLIGVSLAHLVLGIYFYVKNFSGTSITYISWLPIFSLVTYFVMLNIGLGPLPWTISAELFPTNVKPYAASLVASVCFTTAFFVTKFFNDLERCIGQGQTFWLFGGLSLLAFIFTFFFLPETKGRSFQEIQEILKHR